MRTKQELLNAIESGVPLVWNDPDPIEGNDYTITSFEDLSMIPEEDLYDYPILIQYGGGSEAEVFLHEILIKK